MAFMLPLFRVWFSKPNPPSEGRLVQAESLTTIASDPC